RHERRRGRGGARPAFRRPGAADPGVRLVAWGRPRVVEPPRARRCADARARAAGDPLTAPARRAIQELLERLAAGDRTAIEPAFDALWPLLRGFAARALRDEGLAEDAAQQALIKLFEQTSGFDPSRDGVAWAIAITSYEIRTIRRRGLRRREEALDGAADALTTTETPEALAVDRDLARAAREAL